MKHSRTVAILAATAFANAAGAAAAKPKAGAPKADDRIAPVFTAIASAAEIPLPTGARRGAKSPIVEEMNKLEIGQSIGLTNKTKKQISATVSKANNHESNYRPKVDANGQPVMVPGEPMRDAAGVQIGVTPPKQAMERIKEWEVHEMDPKTDPHKAITRIFRVTPSSK